MSFNPRKATQKEIIKNKIADVYKILSKIPLEAWLVAVLPEYGLKWRDISVVLHESCLAVTSENLAQVICRHMKSTMTEEEIDKINPKLRLKLVAIQGKVWHVFMLQQRFLHEPVADMINHLKDRIGDALSCKLKNKKAMIEQTVLCDLIYISVQICSIKNKGTTHYFAIPPGEPALLSCSSSATAALEACVQALGYKSYENAYLYGADIRSLLTISNGGCTAEAANLTSMPPYNPTPVISKNGIDYTNTEYNKNYIDNLIGPNPPLLTELKINSTKSFSDRDLLNKPFSLKVHLKTSNLAGTLKNWAAKGALEPTSELFQIFHTCKSNCIEYTREDSD